MAKILFDSLKICIAFELLIIFRPNKLFYQLHICMAGPPGSLTTWLFAGPPGDRREGRKSRSRGLASIDPKFISQVRILLRYRDRVKEFIVDLVIFSWKRPALFLVSVDNISVALHDLGHVSRGDLGTCGAMEGWFGAYSNTCHSNQSGFSVGVQWADGAKILSSGTSLHAGECLWRVAGFRIYKKGACQSTWALGSVCAAHCGCSVMGFLDCLRNHAWRME